MCDEASMKCSPLVGLVRHCDWPSLEVDAEYLRELAGSANIFFSIIVYFILKHHHFPKKSPILFSMPRNILTSSLRVFGRLLSSMLPIDRKSVG